MPALSPGGKKGCRTRGSEARPCSSRSSRLAWRKRSFYPGVSPRSGSKSELGRGELSWESWVLPWGGLRLSAGAAGSCKRGHAGERGGIGKALVEQG